MILKHTVCSLSLPLLLLHLRVDPGRGLVVPSFQKATGRTRAALFSTTPTNRHENKHKNKKNTRADASTDTMLTEMRADIERMKREAAERLDALNEKLVVVSKQKEEEDQAKAIRNQESRSKAQKELKLANANANASASNSKKRTTIKLVADDNDNDNDDDHSKTLESMAKMADEFKRDMSRFSSTGTSTSTGSDNEVSTTASTIDTDTVAQQPPTPTTDAKNARHPLKLLDDTRWRLCMNVGRVPGTWMPKTWGASGDKLHLKVEVEFTRDELYEREDFFDGISDRSKVLRVVHNEASLAPCMTEGGRTVKVSDGGWKVCPGEGPLGTHVLRFYFDVQEEARHLGSDVYLPKGRVFGTCGYFPMIDRANVDGRRTSKREIYQQEIRQMEIRYVSLRMETESDPDWFSFEKLGRIKEMRELRRDVQKFQKALDEESIKEPKKSSLRMSRDQSVGLTQEGGICCKKVSGITEEYQILGKFEVASIENREHSDYREALTLLP